MLNLNQTTSALVVVTIKNVVTPKGRKEYPNI